MTSLKIDLAKFKTACTESRDYMAAYDCKSVSQHRLSVQYDCEIDWMGTEAPVEPEFGASDLRACLNVAARAVQQFGATPSQINYIVNLAEKAGKFDKRTPSTLTKLEASMIIETMISDQ